MPSEGDPKMRGRPVFFIGRQCVGSAFGRCPTMIFQNPFVGQHPQPLDTGGAVRSEVVLTAASAAALLHREGIWRILSPRDAECCWTN